MKHGRIFRAAGTVSFFTTLSRGLGLLRDMLMASFFGTGVAMSAFVVAFTIPNLSRRLFGEGALSASFIPVFVQTRSQQGDIAAWMLARKIVTLLGLVLLALTLLGLGLVRLLPVLIHLGERWLLILGLLHIMLPYMFFICLAALSMAVLNAHGHFALPAATPCLLNIVWIAAVALLVPRVAGDTSRTIYVVAWAVLLAGAGQLLAQYPLLRRRGYRLGFSLSLTDERVRQVLVLMGPAAFGLALTQFNVLVDRLLAAWIGPWAPAALFFSERLIYFPLGIFATALGTVLLPAFSRHMAANDLHDVRRTVYQSLRGLLFLMMPAAVGLFVLADPIIEMIYQRGVFDEHSTRLSALALRCYAPGLVIFALPKVLVPAFYALQDTRTPLRAGMWTVAINLLANVLLILTLPLYWKHAGIALATVLAEAFFVGILLWRLRLRIGPFGMRKLAPHAGKMLLLSLGMGLAVGWARQRGWLLPEGARQPLQALGVLGMIAGAVLLYLALAWLFGSNELRRAWRALRDKN